MIIYEIKDSLGFTLYQVTDKENAARMAKSFWPFHGYLIPSRVNIFKWLKVYIVEKIRNYYYGI